MDTVSVVADFGRPCGITLGGVGLISSSSCELEPLELPSGEGSPKLNKYWLCLLADGLSWDVPLLGAELLEVSYIPL